MNGCVIVAQFEHDCMGTSGWVSFSVFICYRRSVDMGEGRGLKRRSFASARFKKLSGHLHTEHNYRQRRTF